MSLSSGFLFKILIFSVFCWFLTFFAIAADEVFGIFLSAEVTSSTPENMSRDIPFDSRVIIKFDKPINRKTIQYNITPNILGEWRFENKTLIFIPAIDLDPNTNYKINLENIKSFGISHPYSFSSSFRTAPLPQSLNLGVPFIVQAPFGDWSYPFNHNCEEASVLMAHYYFEGKSVVDPGQTRKELLEMVAFETEKYGYHEDTSAEQTAQFAKDYYGHDVQVHDFSVDNIKKELSRGNPVIVPVAGRLLNNPYFKPPGPPDRVLLIKGYTDTGFITNDPGTKKGADLHFSYQALENAASDYGRGAATGKKLMIIIHAK